MGNIQETFFGPEQYLTVKKSIATSQISDATMYEDAGKIIRNYANAHSITLSEGWCVLYFTWDEEGKYAEIGIGIPMKSDNMATDPSLSIIDMFIPKTKASLAVLHGSYSGLGEIHQALMSYVKKQQFNTTAVPVIAVEEYVIDPMSESNPKNYITNVYYLHH